MSENTETAILAGGCYWATQELMRARREGVISIRAGWTGGESDNPTEENPGGHAEALEIVFDPDRVSYREILELFFQRSTAPTSMNARSAPSIARRSSARSTSSARSPRRRSPTSTPQACGPARS